MAKNVTVMVEQVSAYQKLKTGVKITQALTLQLHEVIKRNFNDSTNK